MHTAVRILLIDDEPIVLDSCTEILRDQGYEVATAADGQGGLAMVRTFRPDVVVADLKMPGISGFEVLERVLATDPTIVALVITGYATVASAVEAMKRGAYDFLPKPFTPDEFRLIIRRAVEKRSLVLETLALRRERELLREHFAAIVSHELRAPLGAVQQNLFVLARELTSVATDAQRERLGRVVARVGDLLQLIETWRRGVSVDIAAIQAHRAAVAVSVPIARAVESLAVEAARNELTVTVSIPDPVPVVWGDAVTLTEAITNLLGNAVKYTRPGGWVTISVEPHAGEVRIAVADNGVGIPAEDLPLVFDAFYSAHPGAAGERGSGLGLAVSRRIVEAHGGTITVRSAPGQGSTFAITLPIHRDDGPEGPRHEGAPVAAPAKDGRR